MVQPTECANKLSLIKYDTPEIKDMAIVITFFNPSRSLRIIQNLLLVKHLLESADIPFYIAELAFESYPFILNKDYNILQIRSNSYMFYKENLLSTIEKTIPKYYSKLCLTDADILFDNKDWYSIISNTLNTNDLCQPFNKAYNLNIDYTIGKTKNSCIDVICNKNRQKYINFDKYHIGYIWAFKREWYVNNNISDMSIIGGGDCFLLYSLMDSEFFLKKRDIIVYKDFYKSLTYNAISNCDLNIYHLFHGIEGKRQYESRFEKLFKLFNDNNISSIKDVVIRRNDNILEWKQEYKALMNNYMINYFNNRDDDSFNEIANRNFKFYPNVYSTPTNRDMAVILCFFNPAKYIRCVQNILTIKNWLELYNIPFYINELAFNNEPFLFEKASNIFQYRSESYLFYKENLNKITEQKIPNSFTKLLFLDADIFFDNPHWYSIISSQLNDTDILLPFKRAFWLDCSYKIIKERSNALDYTNIKIDWDKEHVGFCLAFKRNVFKEIPVYETFFIGGDTQLILYLKSNGDINHKDVVESNFFYNYIPDATYPLKKIEYKYDSSNLFIYHLNHGSIIKRNYYNIKNLMYQYLLENNITCASDFLFKREDDILEIKDVFKDSLNKFLYDYFSNRDEDIGN
jgi:hypothetical protein